jgi:hypothetical protein
MEILNEEEKQERMISGSRSLKRLRGNRDEEFAPMQEFDGLVPSSKRQKQSNPRNYRQVPCNIQPLPEEIHNISTGMTIPPIKPPSE